MHLYGDSFAHQQMSDSTKMYPTGRGHAADMHYPDFPLCSGFAHNPTWQDHCAPSKDGRFAQWIAYLQNIYLVVNPGGGAVPTTVSNAIHNLAASIYALAADGSDANDWNESKVQRALYAPTNPAQLEDFFKRHDATEPCQLVVQAAVTNTGPLANIPLFSCTNVWNRFANIARAEFKRNEPTIRQQQHLDPDPLYDPQMTPFW